MRHDSYQQAKLEKRGGIGESGAADAGAVQETELEMAARLWLRLVPGWLIGIDHDVPVARSLWF